MKSKKRQLASPKTPEKARLDLPLECQDPSDFGYFDAEQHYFLDNGALDLVLIENAAELMRRVMMRPGNIEKVLKLLSKTYEGCAVLPSDTFPIYTDDPNKSWQNTGTKEEYENLVNRMKKRYTLIANKKDVECVYAVFALMVEKDGSGHYGSFFTNPRLGNRVYLFDSMQNSEKGSFYTPFFRKLAEDIFETPNVIFDKNFTPETSLQLTGGFSKNYPLMLLFEDDPEHPLTEQEEEIIKWQSTESQNHFCYMWSIWSLHLRMIGEDPSGIAKIIAQRNVDPLTVIKRYTWALFNYKDLRLIDEIPAKYREFFERHWPAIWSNDPLRKFIPNTFFTRYEVPMDTCQNLTYCIFLSYGQLKVINVQNLTPLTPESRELIECARRKK